MRRIVLGLAAAMLLPLFGIQTAAADSSATITMTDTGFSPDSVTIASGGSVVFQNAGTVTHAATNVAASPSTFNTGGVGPGQSVAISLTTPGTYYYTSATECLNNVYVPNFPCGTSFAIVVLPPGQSAPPQPAPAAPTPTATPAQAQNTGNAAVTISDSGITPPAVTVALNGAVTFTNHGSNVHTATFTGGSDGSLPSFDTGGLGAGQSMTIGFPVAGTYNYTSETDCINGNSTPGFDCATTYTVTVGSTPAPSAPAPPGPTATPVNVPGANVSVTIDDVNGFQPPQVNIKVGQAVGWKNVGNAVHTVVLNQPPQLGQAPPSWLPYPLATVGGVTFDSGGIDPKQTFVYIFSVPGTFPYHSSTEPIYLNNYANCGCTFVNYQFFGSVVVTP